jgi:parallel beta-helix repeat protein
MDQILIDGARGANITENIISFFGTGVHLSESISTFIADNVMEGYGLDNIGLLVTGSWNSTIKNNTISEAIYAGIKLIDSADANIIRGNTIYSNGFGIHLIDAHRNTIVGNEFIDNSNGIFVEGGDNNTIMANTLSNNLFGISFTFSSKGNLIYHNNFISNYQQVYFTTEQNIWNSTLEGNYWSNYAGTDTDYDGIGDVSHPIVGTMADHYPLMGQFHSFSTSLGQPVHICSNSTLTDFEIELNSTVRLFATNSTSTQSAGFCRVMIPKDVLLPPYTVVIDDGLTEVQHFDGLIEDNGTHRWIYFVFEHSAHEIAIVPEVLLPTILSLFMLAASLISLVHRRMQI